MKILNLMLTMLIIVSLAVGYVLCFSSIGVPISLLFDIMPLIIVVTPAYYLTAIFTNSIYFFNDNNAVKQFGSFAMSFAYCSFIIGGILFLGRIGQPTPPGVDPAHLMSYAFYNALTSMLYGILVKYILCPIIINLKKIN